MDLRFGGTCYECVSAVACYGCLIILRMNSFFHVIPLLFLICVRDLYKIPLKIFRHLSKINAVTILFYVSIT